MDLFKVSIDDINRLTPKVWQRAFATAGETLTNFPVDILGKRLQVLRNNTATKDAGMLKIRFNTPDSFEYDLVTGSLFTLPFHRVYLSGSEIVGSASQTDLQLVAFQNETGIVELPQYPAKRYESFTGGVAQAAKGMVISVFIETFGNLTFLDYQGNTHTIPNVLPGQQYFLNLHYVLSATTCDGILGYAY